MTKSRLSWSTPRMAAGLGLLLLATPLLAHAAPKIVRPAPQISQAGLPKRPPSYIQPCYPYIEREPLSVSRLAPGRLLWIRTCGTSDYNRIGRLYLSDEQGRKLAALADDDTDEITAAALEIEAPAGGASVRWNTVFDPMTRVLTATVYDTEQRASGSRNQWIWDGRRFRYARTSERPWTMERGRPPEQWPETHRAKNVEFPSSRPVRPPR